MSDAAAGAGPSGWIEVRRFPEWRPLREWVAREAFALPADTPADTLAAPASDPDAPPLRIVVPDSGAQWVLERMLRERLPAAGGGAFPEVGVAEALFRDLAGELDPPFRLAPPLVREMLMEEALLAGAAEEDAPPGDPAQLADPFLAFLDEQSGDRRIAVSEPAFEAFLRRAGKHFGEAEETDEGAARLARLTRWLRRAHARYREGIEAAARADGDSLRRMLLAHAEELRPRFRGARLLALGEEALRPAEAALLFALLPPGALVWGLVAGSPDPVLPEGLELRDPAGDSSPESSGLSSPGPSSPDPSSESRGPRRQPSLFDLPPPPPSLPKPPAAPRVAPAIFVPAAAAGSPDLGPVFRATDRDGEMRLAARLLRRFREEAGADFRGHHRCALAAQRPADYLEAADAVLPAFGIPLATRQEARLTREPWVASVADALEFAGNPGRLSTGIRLLRGPFFDDPELPAPPPRCADLLAAEALGAGIRDTNAPGDLRRFAARLLGRAARKRDRAAGAEEPERPQKEARRAEARARAMEMAAATLERLAAFAGALAPLRKPDAGFRGAVEALVAFLDQYLRPPEEEEVRDRTIQTLLQAAGAAPEGARAGGSEPFARRLRRLLHRRTLPRRPVPRRTPPAEGEGTHLIAAADAPFGDYDFLVLLGMVDADWPGPRPDNIFFPMRLLEAATRSRHSRRRSREIRLLRAFPGLPRRAAAFTRPELDDGFPVGVSPLEAELIEAALDGDPPHRRVEVAAEVRSEAAGPGRVEPLPAALDRRAPSARALEDPVSPTGLVTYARSPAQFFARRILRLDEERPLADTPPPTERGELLHGFLHRGYEALSAAGIGIRETNLDEVLAFFREEFRRFAEGRHWSGAERRVEERWLFGGEATPGALEWFLREEADRGPTAPTKLEEWISGEVEGAAAEAPALVVAGRLDRLDRLTDGTRRIVEYKSGRFYEKQLQARLYARILEKADGTRTDYAIPHFGDRRWIGPGDKPDDAEQDRRIREIRDALAGGEFPAPADGDSPFDFALFARRDLREAAGGGAEDSKP